MLCFIIVAIVGAASAADPVETYAGYTQPIIQMLDRMLYVLTGNATNSSIKISDQCQNSASLLVGGIEKKAMWALKIIDATGKPSTGLLEPGAVMPGFFSECISTEMFSNEKEISFQGKYCMAEIKIPEGKFKVNTLKDHSWNILRNSTPKIGLCVPSVCTDEDIYKAVEYAARYVVEDVAVTMNTCYTTANNFSQDPAAISMTVIILIMLLLVLVGTFLEIAKSMLSVKGTNLDKKTSTVSTESMPVTTASSEILCEKKELKERCLKLKQFLLCFSLKTNGKKVLFVDKVEGSIDSLHGIRFISMVWIIVGHSFSFANEWLFIRKAPGEATITIDFFSQIFANGTLAVDTFLFLSGFLVALGTLKYLKKREGKLNLFMFYFHRYIRMTPLMMAIIGFCACILRYISTGPNWIENIYVYDDWCRRNWWTNLIYLQNFINRENMCLSHTWYSAVDMQMYLISPICIYSLYKGKKYGLPICALFLAVTIGLTAYLTAVNHYPAIPYISNIVPLSLMNDYFGYVYIKPYCRLGPYIVGILLAYMLHDQTEPITISKTWVAIGWISSTAANLFIIYAMWPANKGILPTVGEATAYGALSRTVWAISLAWLTFACITGYGGFVDTLLSWKPIIPLSRLTYCAYLLHPVLMVIFYSTRELAFDLSVYFMLYIVVGNLVFTYVFSFVLSLIFESPLIALEKVFLPKT